MSMVALSVDGIRVEVPEGSTILEAAGAAGIDIPTLCRLEGFPHQSSCMVCTVEESPGGRLVPSCAGVAREGLDVMTSTTRVLSARAAAVELLLSEHSGDCLAPCSSACPANLNVMETVRLAEAGMLRDALLPTLDAIPFPGLMAAACAGYCERVCRRAGLDSPIGIRSIHAESAAASTVDERAAFIRGGRSRADAAAAGSASSPPLAGVVNSDPAVGMPVLIPGAGLAALAAAFHLMRAGFPVTLIGDPLVQARQAEVGKDILGALARETEILRLAGCSFESGPRTLAPGERLLDVQAAPDEWRIPAREMARGRIAAERLFVSEPGVVTPSRKFHSIVGDMREDELHALASVAGLRPGAGHCSYADHDKDLGRSPGAGRMPGLGHAAGIERSPAGGICQRAKDARCLACGCTAEKDCRLRMLAALTGARQQRFSGSRLPVRRLRFSMEGGELVFEPGKCILCGICVRLSQRTPFPLSFIGRGFLTAVGGFELYALGADREAGAGLVFQRIASRCPTGSLAWEEERDA